MAIDIRATVTCSLGTLISGSISDDYLQGSGLVKTRGSVEISALITPAIGTAVTFSYVKNGITRKIPRKLRVMSSFADPFRRTTKVELGCKLTYLSDLKDPIKWDAFDDPENAAVPPEENRIITVPIFASSVMGKCLSELGIFSSGAGLTNKFSIAEFDFSAGYVQILSDLLISESYFGYLDTDEVLQVRDLNTSAGTGPVFTATDIVDLGPIGVGQLPGEAVTVSYSTLKLTGEEACEDDEEEKTKELNWEYEETIGAEITITVQYTKPNNNPPDQKFYKTWTYIPKTISETTYDDWDRVTKRVSTQYLIGAAVNTQYYIDTWLATAEGIVTYIGFYEESEQQIVDTETFEYAIPAKGERPETGYEEVLSRKLIKEEPQMAIAGAIAASFLEDDGSLVNYMPLYGSTITEEIIQTYDTKQGFINGAYTPITKTSVTKRMAYGYTQYGQQETARQVEAGGSVSEAIFNAMNLVDAGTEFTINSGRGVGLQERPLSAELTNAAYADGGDPNNGFRTESKGELELAVGSATAQRRIEFSLPYAPDDLFTKISEDPVCYRGTPSDAPQKAATFGRVQNRLLLGNRNGINLQLSPDRLPSAPFDPLYVQASGLTAIYRANGTSWAFDSNGIVASVDALFWAAVGGTGTFWFPVAPGITTLPTTPAVVDTSPTEVIGTIATVGATPQTALNAAFPAATSGDGVQDQTTGDFWVYDGSTWNDVGTAPGPTTTATTVVLPYNETAVYDGILRTRLDITKFDYSLTLLTTVPTTPIKIQAGVRRILKVEPPVGASTLAAGTPTVSGGGSAKVPVAATALAVIAPAVSGGGSVAAPAGTVTLVSIAPEIQATQSTDVIVPVAELAVASVTPTVVSGVSIAPPSASITLAALVPLFVGFADDGFFGSYVAQVFGWDAGIQPDWWAD